MAETRRKFDRYFKEGAVRLVRETGRPIAEVGRDLEALIPGRMQGHGGTAEVSRGAARRAVRWCSRSREQDGKGHGELARATGCLPGGFSVLGQASLIDGASGRGPRRGISSGSPRAYRSLPWGADCTS